MKNILPAALIAMLSVVAQATQNQVNFHKDISFKKADVSINMKCAVYFRDVSIVIPSEDLVIDADNINIRLEKDSNMNYTTLDISNLSTGNSVVDRYSAADKVMVVVRSREDYKAWNDFLKKAKKTRDAYIRKSLLPVRVLPPKL